MSWEAIWLVVVSAALVYGLVQVVYGIVALIRDGNL